MKFRAMFICVATALTVSAATANDKPTQVMVLGSYHMANPGNDIHNADVDDVTTPEKQKQLEDVAKRLAKFKPTKIALEGDPTSADFTSSSYHSFSPKELASNPDERVQVGFRLASRLGHKQVYLIDESSDVIDYFPYQQVVEYAKKHDESSVIDALNAEVAAKIETFDKAQKEMTVAELLARENDPDTIKSEHDRFYYGLLQLADWKSQPAAELNAYWYMRNAKIMSKLIQIAEPGDRIVVIFGAGHAFWLRHFVENTPGFELVEPNDFLR